MKRSYDRLFLFIVHYCLIILALISSVAFAQIKTDPNAPSNQRPTVLLAPNGIPVVNIQTPSTAGVSRNAFKEFDVNSHGAIVNNSRSDKQTQLGGWIQGNPWLAAGSARIILNEVNSSDPSFLNGWVETAGDRAQLVIANPAGIQCNGCGFINANKVTLATGTPIVNSGSLEGYRQTSGNVRIEGLGLDASQTDALNIFTRSAEINAGIWAQKLNVVTGNNDIQVDKDGQISTVTPIIITPVAGSYPGRANGKPTPPFALDVAYLGGMYAGHIFIFGTEAGLGTRNLGTLKATQELTLNTAGWLDNKGSETAPKLSISADQLNNHGLINGDNVSLNSSSIQNLGTGRIYGDHLALQANTILNAAETIGDITSHPVIAARQRLDIGVGTLNNRDGALILSAGDAAIGRQMEKHVDANTGQSTDMATGIADIINNDSATIDIQGNADINAVNVNNRNTHLTITQVDEPKFKTQRLLVARTNAIYPANQCWGLGGSGDVYCIVHPEVYGQRQAVAPVRGFSFCFLGICGGEVINYAWNDPIFSRFNVTPVGPPPAEPAIPGGVSREGKPGGCTGVFGSPMTTPACVTWRKDYEQWNVSYQASLDALSIPVNAYNASVNEDNRLHVFEDYTWYELTGSPSRSQVTSTAPSIISVGGNLNVTGNGASDAKLTNKDSQIIVGGNINLTDTALNNQETKGTYRVQYNGTAQFTTIETCGTFGDRHCREWHGKTAYNPAPEITTINLPTGSRYDSHSTSSSTPINDLAINALFSVKNPTDTNPIGGYLIETDPAYANYRNWLSSDYLLNALSLNPAMTQKRLGDGYYEQSLLRDQVAQLTGRRFLQGYSNDEAEFLALMNNGVTYARDWNLRPGIALTKEQMAQLTSDMVWLVDQTVTLADGSTTHVLMPQLYVRSREGDLDTNGALISGDSITASLTGDLSNGGTIAGRTLVAFTADNINNLAGRLEGEDVNLNARTDINNIGGHIAAENSLIINAANDLKVESTTQSSSNTIGLSRFTRTGMDRIAGLYITGSNTYANSSKTPTLIATAGNNISLRGGQIINSGTGQTQIRAGQTIEFAAVTTSQDDNAVWDAKNHSRLANNQDIGTRIETQGDIALESGRDITARAANITSQGAINVQAGRDLYLEAGQSHTTNDQARHYTTSGTFSSTTTTTRDLFDQSTSVASTLSGNSVHTQAGRDTHVQGSTIVADADINVNAGRDIQVISDTNTHSENHYKDEKTSGIMGSGGFGISIGSRELSNDQKNHRTTATASSIGSLGTNNSGNVNVDAGRHYQQTGSDVLALKGDVNITAQQVDINEARETQDVASETQFKQTGVTVAISTPVLTAIQTVEQMSTAASNTSDGRMKALAAATSALAVDRAAGAVLAGQGQTIDGKANQIVTGTNPDGTLATRDANAIDKIGGVDISVSFGTSKSHSQSAQTSDTSARSHIAAGKDVYIAAKNDVNATQESKAPNNNLTIQGGQVDAGNTITLQADDEILLQAAKETSQQRSKNNSSSASAGMSFGTNGVVVNLAGSQGRGKGNGDDITWVNTEINSKEKVTTTSGTNTTIKGAVISAPEIVTDVGTQSQGNLVIESLQDISTYHSQQKNVGGSLSVGAGRVSGNINFNQSKVDSDYASVHQQSGLRAGDSGFNVNVKGDTTLYGGAITSTEKAINDRNNTFTTSGQLSTFDIQNKANYQADSVGVNIGTGFSPSGSFTPQGTGVGIGSDGKKESSTTLAAISGIAGNKAARTGDKEAALVNTFDAEKVQKDIDAQVAITQTFGTLASKAVGDYSQNQLNQAKALREQAGQESDSSRAQTLLDQAQQIESNWGDQGSARLAAHTVIGALTGGAAGAAGAAASTLSAPLISDALAKAGINPTLSNMLTAAGSSALGAAAGSMSGSASGSIAGAAGALNEVANNYLTHAEALQREKALQQKQACTSDECRQNAQKTINDLNQVDAWRDAQLQTACANPSSSLCQGLNSALQIAKESYATYDPKTDINSTVAGERNQVNNQAFKYQQRIDNPFAYGVGKGLLKLSPPALLLDVSYGVYSLTTAILDNGLETTAINIARGISNLPSELKTRLYSTDPSVRGEALVDVIALGSSAAYLTQQLGLAVVSAADQAITKSAAKIAAKRAEEEAVTAAKNNNHLYSDGYQQTKTSSIIEATPIKDNFGRAPNESDLAQHLSTGGPSSPIRGVSGAHNEAAFKDELSSINGQIIGTPAEIAPGIKVYQYNTPERIVKNAKPLTKTTYDETYTDSQILEMSKQASRQGWSLYQKTGQLSDGNSIYTTVGNIPFKVNFSKDQSGNISIYSHPGKE